MDHQLVFPPHALWLLLLCNKAPCLTAIELAVSHGPAGLSPAAPQLTSVPLPAGKPEREAVLLSYWPLLYSVARAVVSGLLCSGQRTAAAAAGFCSNTSAAAELAGQAGLLSYWPLLYSVARAVVIEPLCSGLWSAAAAGFWSSSSAGKAALDAVLLLYIPLLYSVARAVVIELLCSRQGTAAAAGFCSNTDSLTMADLNGLAEWAPASTAIGAALTAAKGVLVILQLLSVLKEAELAKTNLAAADPCECRSKASALSNMSDQR